LAGTPRRKWSALELGCGTGRLLRALQRTVPDLVGLDLSPEMVAYARARVAVPVMMADMSDFSCGRSFDLLYTSANTIRCVLETAAIRRMWGCIAAHLAPGGVFIADLELGFAAEAQKVSRPVHWMLSRAETLVHVTWCVTRAPAPTTRCCTVEWTFELRDQAQEAAPPRIWREEFSLRTYDAAEFLDFAASNARLTGRGLYEIRDPYLLERPVDKVGGRVLVVLQRA
jgi:SAM-dependent methyltransferase